MKRIAPTENSITIPGGGTGLDLGTAESTQIKRPVVISRIALAKPKILNELFKSLFTLHSSLFIDSF
jgi:hypothetical protein